MPSAFARRYNEKMRHLLTLAMALSLSTPALAGDEFDAAFGADFDVEKVQAALKAATKGDAKKEADAFRVANDVFQKIVQEEGGDMDRIEARLLQYKKNPDSLGQLMNEQDKAVVRGLASSPPTKPAK